MTTTLIYTTHQTNNHLKLTIISGQHELIFHTQYLYTKPDLLDFATFRDNSPIYLNRPINVFLTEIGMRDRINA